MKILILAAILLVLGLGVPAGAAAVTPTTLGFDPAKFSVPVYPGSSLRVGGATSGKSFSGKSEKSAVLETSDPVEAVANWYAQNWSGASRQTSPGAALTQFSKPWGAGAITVSIFRSGPQTYIRILVPGAY